MSLICRRFLQAQSLLQTWQVGGVWSQTVKWKQGLSKEKKIKLRKEKEDMCWLEPLNEYKAEKALETCQQEPHQLHVVWRVRAIKGRPWWEKEILKKYGLDGEGMYPVVIKNTPSDNKRLIEVKHLLRIRPLTAPEGLPDNESDFEHCTIKLNGELVFNRKPQSLETQGPIYGKSEKWSLQKETLRNELDYKKRMYEVHKEYFPTVQSYKRNQDGKEYRYNFSKEPVLKGP